MMGLYIPPNRKLVHIKAQYEGQHHWPGAPEEVEFLRDVHRHVFHVELHIEVKHEDRELEFILVKRWLERYPFKDLEAIGKSEGDKRISWSCERMAQFIGEEIRRQYGTKRYVAVGVYEDGENGGIVIWDR